MKNRKKNETPKRHSLWIDVWRRLKRNRLNVICIYILSAMIILTLFAPLIAPYDYKVQEPKAKLIHPNIEHLMGTDNFGRDIFSRVLIGSKYTLAIGFGCMTFALVISMILGCLAVMVKRLDNVIMRFIDIVMSIPAFMLSITLVTALGVNLRNMMIAIGVCAIGPFTRVVRASMLTVRDAQYVEVARSIGASDWHILIKHIIPNSLAPIIVQYTTGMVTAILTAASLSFLGLGIQAPEPEWGSMVSAGRRFLMSEWYMSILPGLAIILMTLSLSILGDGLRDALDPKLK